MAECHSVECDIRPFVTSAGAKKYLTLTFQEFEFLFCFLLSNDGRYLTVGDERWSFHNLDCTSLITHSLKFTVKESKV